VPFNARLREETDLDALSEGLVGVAGHHAAQAHLLVAASRDTFNGGASGLATTYSPECVEGRFYEVQSCKDRGYSHRPNTTNATPITTAATTAAKNVATNTKGILAGLGQIFEGD
jgi:hypothetical protein